MNKIYFLLIFVSFFAINARSQVTIGSQDAPAPGAVLELKSTNLGFLPSRVELTNLNQLTPLTGTAASCEGMIVYNKTVQPADGLIPGLYLWDGAKWLRLTVADSEKWFYMPSIVIETDTDGPGTRDLFDLCKDQLYSAGSATKNGGGTVVKNAAAPAQVLSRVPAVATDFYYYITDYDAEVFKNVAVTNEGILTYTVQGPATDKTFMNIVLVEK